MTSPSGQTRRPSMQRPGTAYPQPAAPRHAPDAFAPGAASPWAGIAEALGLLQGKEAVAASGLVAEHAAIMQSVMHEHNAVLMLRPVSHEATSLIAEGYAPKGPEIKGKSADWGPMAGLIPFDQALSKVWADPSQVALLNQKNHASLLDYRDKVVTQPLQLSLRRVMELFGEGVTGQKARLQWIDPSDASPMVARSTVEGQTYEFQLQAAVKGAKDRFDVSYRQADQPDWQPLLVMAQPNGRPYTADYDVFAYLPHLSTHTGSELHPELRALPNIRASGPGKLRRTVGLVMDSVLDTAARRAAPDSIRRETRQERHLRDAIHAGLTAAGHSPMITHATEQENTGQPNCDPDLMIITPDGCLATQTWQQVQAVWHAACDAGHVGIANRVYGDRPGGRPYPTEAARPPNWQPIAWNPRAAYEALTSATTSAARDVFETQRIAPAGPRPDSAPARAAAALPWGAPSTAQKPPRPLSAPPNGTLSGTPPWPRPPSSRRPAKPV